MEPADVRHTLDAGDAAHRRRSAPQSSRTLPSELPGDLQSILHVPPCPNLPALAPGPHIPTTPMQELPLYNNPDAKVALVGYAQEMYQYTFDLWTAAKKRLPQPSDGQTSSDDDDDDTHSSLNTPVPVAPSIPAPA
ncbi:uncharacterized protein B0H18DRAFT_1114026 [Fomitopsis serialis]|uniref:uncharacterized protein n=1 Tax=Fomitopsis serialis TaxID=139415 RepID=UPI0020087C09|nr:uncharacterized protein B0H18DRAFT_1114026 [Neoantrodia serialis]KAH9936668.1 hypothetical protein B0H18DRAFT_1114026 [Neoantrodia serialis]